MNADEKAYFTQELYDEAGKPFDEWFPAGIDAALKRQEDQKQHDADLEWLSKTHVPPSKAGEPHTFSFSMDVLNPNRVTVGDVLKSVLKALAIDYALHGMPGEKRVAIDISFSDWHKETTSYEVKPEQPEPSNHVTDMAIARWKDSQVVPGGLTAKQVKELEDWLSDQWYQSSDGKVEYGNLMSKIEELRGQ